MCSLSLWARLASSQGQKKRNRTVRWRKEGERKREEGWQLHFGHEYPLSLSLSLSLESDLFHCASDSFAGTQCREERDAWCSHCWWIFLLSDSQSRNQDDTDDEARWESRKLQLERQTEWEKLTQVTVINNTECPMTGQGSLKLRLFLCVTSLTLIELPYNGRTSNTHKTKDIHTQTQHPPSSNIQHPKHPQVRRAIRRPRQRVTQRAVLFFLFPTEWRRQLKTKINPGMQLEEEREKNKEKEKTRGSFALLLCWFSRTRTQVRVHLARHTHWVQHERREEREREKRASSITSRSSSNISSSITNHTFRPCDWCVNFSYEKMTQSKLENKNRPASVWLVSEKGGQKVYFYFWPRME